MPFWSRNAPTTFQKLLDEFLKGMEHHVQTYKDDIIVYSTTVNEYMRHLFDIKKRLDEYWFKVSREKTKLFQRSVKFLGYNPNT